MDGLWELTLKNCGKSSRGRTQGLSHIFRAPIASRGHLCGSSAFLFYRGIAPLTPGIHASVAAADVVATVIDGYKYRDVPIGSVQMTVV